jgi:hypothetical protein
MTTLLSASQDFEMWHVHGSSDMALRTFADNWARYMYHGQVVEQGTFKKQIEVFVNPGIELQLPYTYKSLLTTLPHLGKVLGLLLCNFSRMEVLELIQYLAPLFPVAADITRLKYAEMKLDEREVGVMDVLFDDLPVSGAWRIMSCPNDIFDMTPSWAWHYASAVFKKLTLGKSYGTYQFIGRGDPIGFSLMIAQVLRRPPVDTRPFVYLDGTVGKVLVDFDTCRSIDLMGSPYTPRSTTWASEWRIPFTLPQIASAVQAYKVRYNIQSFWDFEDRIQVTSSSIMLLQFLAEERLLYTTVRRADHGPRNEPFVVYHAPRSPFFYDAYLPEAMTTGEFDTYMENLWRLARVDYRDMNAVDWLDRMVFMLALRQTFGDWPARFIAHAAEVGRLHRTLKGPDPCPENVFMLPAAGLGLLCSMQSRVHVPDLENYQEAILCVAACYGEDICTAFRRLYLRTWTPEVSFYGIPYSEIKPNCHRIVERSNMTQSYGSEGAPKVWTFWKGKDRWLERPNLYMDNAHCTVVLGTKTAPDLVYQSDLCPSYDMSCLPWSGRPLTFEFVNDSVKNCDARFHFPETDVFAFRFVPLPDNERARHHDMSTSQRSPLVWLTFRWKTGEFLMLPIVTFTRPVFPVRTDLEKGTKTKGRAILRKWGGEKNVILGQRRDRRVNYSLALVDGLEGIDRMTDPKLDPWTLSYGPLVTFGPQEKSAHCSVSSDFSSYKDGQVRRLDDNTLIFDLKLFSFRFLLEERHNSPFDYLISGSHAMGTLELVSPPDDYCPEKVGKKRKAAPESEEKRLKRRAYRNRMKQRARDIAEARAMAEALEGVMDMTVEQIQSGITTDVIMLDNDPENDS